MMNASVATTADDRNPPATVHQLFTYWPALELVLAADSPYSPTQRFVLVALLGHLDKNRPDGRVWPSLAKVCAETGYSRSTVCAALAAVEEMQGPITLRRVKRWDAKGDPTSTEYRFGWGSPPAGPPPTPAAPPVVREMDGGSPGAGHNLIREHQKRSERARDAREEHPHREENPDRPGIASPGRPPATGTAAPSRPARTPAPPKVARASTPAPLRRADLRPVRRAPVPGPAKPTIEQVCAPVRMQPLHPDCAAGLAMLQAFLAGQPGQQPTKAAIHPSPEHCNARGNATHQGVLG